MKRPRIAAALALTSAAACLAACSPPASAPPALKVSTVSVSEAQSMAKQFCVDLDRLTQKEAISKMATRASVAKLTDAEQNAIIDYAASTTCPELL